VNKNWRLTAAFGVLFVICAGIYFFSSNPATTPIQQLDPRVLDLTADRVTKIEVDRKGNPLTFERTTDALGEYWRVVGPVSHAAETALVQQMLYGLDRFLKLGALDPGKPESAPELTGLSDPRITVTFTAAGRREVLKFGKSPPTNTTVVCYQHEGDPKIYLVSVDTFEAFDKPVFQYSAKTLARFAPHRVNKVAVEFKFIRPQGKDKPPLVEYEKSVMERYEEGMERGWYLTQPHRERLDDIKVATLVTNLSSLQAAEYQPPGKDQGFEEPQLKVSMFLAGDDKPVEIHFGADKGKQIWVRLLGSDDVALYDYFRYDDLPRQRSQFRNSVIFPFSSELVKRMEIEAKDMGKVVLERRELKKPGESVPSVKWEVTEPPGMRVESERLEAFVAAVVPQQVVNFLGVQDFKQAGLDPAAVRVLIETREGKKHQCWFSPAGFLRKEGVDEIFEVRPELVQMLQRLELNFLNMEMFNIPRADLLQFSFEARASAELQPVYYAMKLDQKANKWVFSDPGHKGKEPDPNKVNDLLAILNYIKADSMIARDEKTIAKYALNERVAPATLKITHEKGVADLYISEDLSNKAGLPMHYARFSDSKTVFQLSGSVVSTLKRDPVLKPEEKEEKPDKDK
jgi:hypothetical protein